MVQASLSTSTSFEANPNALVESLDTELTISITLDEPAPAGGLRVYIDSDTEQILNRLDLPSVVANPVVENIELISVRTNLDNSGIAITIIEGADFASFTLPIFDNPEPDTFLPETFDGLVEATFALRTASEVSDADSSSITDLSDYTIAADAGSSVVLFADDVSQLPGAEPEPPEEPSTPPETSGYDEAVSGDISGDPANPLELPLSEGTTTLSATTGEGEQEYVTVTVPEGFQLDSLVLEAYSPNDVGFIGVQEGDTFTEPLDDTADRGNILGYTLFGNPRQIGTDILDEIGNGLNAQGFEGALPSGTYTFALQQLGAESDYTLAFNVSEAGEPPEEPTTPPEEPTTPPEEPTTPPGELPVVSFEAIPSTISEEGSADERLLILQWQVTGEIPPEGLVVNFDNLFGITDQLDGGDDRAAANNLEFAGFDRENNRINIRLLANEASFELPVANDLIEDGTTEFDFILAPGDGYILDPEQNSTFLTITDDNGGPGVGPTVGMSVVSSELNEGEEFTVNFALEGAIPEGGVDVLVQSSLRGALGLFDIADLSNLTLAGIDGLPTIGDTTGSSFIVRIVEPEASITLTVFDNIVAEEIREAPFEIVNGELYEVDPDAAGFTLTISDEPQPEGPTVGLTVDRTDVIEGESITLSFEVVGEIPTEGVTVLVNDVASAESGLRSLTEFDVANIEFTGISEFPSPAEGDSGFFVTITDPTATITIPIFDEGADEDEATESFTFELIDGEAYNVDPDAGSVTLNLADVGDTPVPGSPQDEIDEAVFDFSWTGQIAGFSVEGQFSYDANQSFIEGIVREEDLLSFDISFFDPDGNLLRTYEDNHLTFPEFNFAYDTTVGEILTDGIFTEPDGFNVGEKTAVGEDSFTGLNFWSKSKETSPSLLHIDDWSDEFGFPLGYSSHEDIAFLTQNIAELIETGKVGESYLDEVQDRLDEVGQPIVVTPAVDEVFFDFSWTGQIADFSVEGQFSYDANQSFIEGIVREEDLLSFDISFFDPEGNLLRTYEDNHLTFPEFNFAYDTTVGEILTDGIFTEPDGFNVGEKTAVGEDSFTGLNFWSKSKETSSSLLHIDDWSDEFGFPLGYSSHEDIAFLTQTNAELIETGKVGEFYLEATQATPDEIGQPIVVTPADSTDSGTVDSDIIEVAGSGQSIFARDLNDLIDATTGSGSNSIFAGAGDDTLLLGRGDRLFGEAGDDRFFVTSGGDNLITGGAGTDQFWVAVAEIPEDTNIVTDFTLGEDVIGIAGLGIGFADVGLTQEEADVLVSVDSSNLALLQNVDVAALSEADFAFV